MESHLKDANGPLSETQLRVGLKLTVDPKSESFLNDKAEADLLLTREYRKGFEVPAKV